MPSSNPLGGGIKGAPTSQNNKYGDDSDDEDELMGWNKWILSHLPSIIGPSEQ